MILKLYIVILNLKIFFLFLKLMHKEKLWKLKLLILAQPVEKAKLFISIYNHGFIERLK